MAKVYTFDAYCDAVKRGEYMPFFSQATLSHAESALKGVPRFVVVVDFDGLSDQYIEMVRFAEENGIPCYFLNHYTAFVSEASQAVLIGLRF